MSRSRLGVVAAVVVLVVAATVLIGVRAFRGDPDGTATGAGTATEPGVAAPKVVGYFTQWGVYDRDYQVKNVQTSGTAAKLTHLVYAFGSTDGGRCGVNDPDADHDRVVPAGQSVDGVADSPADPLRGSFGQLRKLKVLNPQLKVLWSFGGWSDSAGFTRAAADPAAFAESCRRLVTDPRWADVFDGIDIDWEYPNACGRTCDTSGPDALTKLTAALRTAFGPDTLITAAVTADAEEGGKLSAADYAGAATRLDWVMAMTYDFAGTSTSPGPTAPHSALSAYPGLERPGSTTEAAVDALLAKGVPAGKILLGIGFYGRGWTGVTRAEPGGRATGPAAGTWEVGVEDYRVLRTSCPPTGTVGGTAYGLCRGQWWSYDTPATITTKMRYATGKALGGAFVWELSGDTADGELITAVATGLNRS